MQKTVYTTGEAAKICKVSQQTIIRCFDSGQLKGFRVPGSRFRRIPRDQLFLFMRDNGIPTDALESGRRKILVVDDFSATLTVTPCENWNKDIAVSVNVTDGHPNSYDNDGNTTDSETINVIIDNFLIYNTTFGFEGTSEAGHSILQTMDSNFVILGSTGEDILLLKTNHAGDKLWHQTFGGSQTDKARHIQQTSDGGYIISGTTKSYGSGGLDIWLIKTDASGLIEWNKYFGSSEDEHAGQVQQTPDGLSLIHI